MSENAIVPDEIWNRLRTVEGSLQSHESACGVRWANQDKANSKLDSIDRKINRFMGGFAVLIFVSNILAVFVAQWLFTK